MTITPKIREVHQRHIAIDLTADQVSDIILAEVRRVAGIPAGAALTVTMDARPVEVRIAQDLSRTPAPMRRKVSAENTGKHVRWTEQDDATVLAIIAANPGMTVSQWADLAAQQMPGRTSGAIQVRWRTVLQQRQAPVEVQAPAPIPSAISQHLTSIGMPDGWTRDEDRELLGMIVDGERNMTTLGGIFDREPAWIVHRVAQLTGRFGRAEPRFTPEAVLAEMGGCA